MCNGHGGDALAALLVAKAQRARGHDATIVIGAAQHAESFVRRAQLHGVPTEFLSDVPTNDGRSLPARAFVLARSLAHLHGDVLHVHTGDLIVRTADVIAVRCLRFERFVVTVQSPTDWSCYDDSSQQKDSWLRASVGFGRLICPSRRSMALQIEAGIPERRVSIVANPIESAAFGHDRRGGTRADLAIDPTDHVVLFASRLDEDKRPVATIEAFALAHRARPRMRLLMVGTGSLEDDCRRLVVELGLDDAVTFLGYRTDVPALLEAADTFILLSKWESFGMAVAEAMAAGATVVTTSALEEVGVVEADRTAVVVDASAHDQIARALISLVDDPARARRLAEAAAEDAVAFDVERVVDRLQSVYASTPACSSSLIRRYSSALSVLAGGTLSRLLIRPQHET